MFSILCIFIFCFESLILIGLGALGGALGSPWGALGALGEALGVLRGNLE